MTRHEVTKLIGKENWGKFLDWMCGQTVGMDENGETNFYDCDVLAFKKKLDGGPDRQKDPKAWD